MSAQDTLSEAYDQAYEVFEKAGANTDDVDSAFNVANSWSKTFGAAWDATEDTVKINDAWVKAGNLRCQAFFTELSRLYNERYTVDNADPINKYLDSAMFASEADADNIYDQRVQTEQIEEAIDNTVKDIKKAAKFSVLPLVLLGGVFLWMNKK